MKLLSIAVPCYNSEAYMRNCVESLLKGGEDVEIIIVNDGSKDNTAQIGVELERLTTNDGKSIVRLISKENGGHGSTINVGIENARGKYTKIMDGDDALDSHYLSELIDILEKENEIEISYTGDGFLQHMIRIMTGTLIEVGNGTKKPEEIPKILESKVREKAGYTVPAEGLMLKEVVY